MTENSTERYYADMEHARNVYEDEYFKARPQLVHSPAERALFRAGFERAFEFLVAAVHGCPRRRIAATP